MRLAWDISLLVLDACVIPSALITTIELDHALMSSQSVLDRFFALDNLVSLTVSDINICARLDADKWRR